MARTFRMKHVTLKDWRDRQTSVSATPPWIDQWRHNGGLMLVNFSFYQGICLVIFSAPRPTHPMEVRCEKYITLSMRLKHD
jgi:hypothetical protein